MDTSTPEVPVKSHLVDVSEMPLIDLLHSKDAKLVASVQRLLVLIDPEQEVTYGWASHIDQPVSDNSH